MLHTLYYSPGACSLAPHILLEEVGRPFKLSLVSTSDGSTRSAAFLRVNPKGRVPVLTIGDEVLTEAPAILYYLATKYPAAGLVPESPNGLARSIEWLNWLSGTVHSIAIRQVWRPESFTESQDHHEAIVASGKQKLGEAFAYIESRMSGSIWALGSTYSMVDAFLLVVYRWGNRIGFDMPHQYKAWTGHTRSLLDRDAVRRALATEDISVWK